MTIPLSPPVAYHLKLPPLVPIPARPDDMDLASRLKACDRLYGRAEDCFGLELKVAWSIADRPEALRFSETPPADLPNLRRFPLRPAMEPLVTSWWKRLAELDLDMEAVRKIASTLNAAPVEISKHQMRSRGAGGEYAVYAPPQEARRFIDDIRNHEHMLESPIDRALHRFARTLQAHPLEDGNGRLARALLLGALAKDGLISSPYLPLGPVYYRNSDFLVRSFRMLSEAQDWRVFFSAMRPLIETALRAAQAWAPATPNRATEA